jgi:hypothetical protein
MKSSTRLKNYLEEFIQQRGTKNKLVKLFRAADERERAGFEKWLQFELMLFFRDHEDIQKVEIEKKVGSDKRTGTDKAHFQTDIVITLKSGDTLGLELKVRRLAVYAEKALRSDLRKHEQTLPKDKATANFSVVLCGQDIDPERRKSLSELSNFLIIDIDAGNFVYFLMAEEGA